jgi:hypothetical protein
MNRYKIFWGTRHMENITKMQVGIVGIKSWMTNAIDVNTCAIGSANLIMVVIPITYR